MTLKVTVSGGIRIKNRKVGDGGPVGTVVETLRTTDRCYVRNSERPGFVVFKRSDGELQAWVHRSASDLLPTDDSEYPWAVDLIAKVKKAWRGVA